MTTTTLKYKILSLIHDMLDDTSVASHVTYEALLEIMEQCKELMETLEDDL